MPSCRAMTAATASIPPAAPRACPVMDLVEHRMARRASVSPRASLMAAVSDLSFRGVPVPWVLMCSRSEGL